MDNKARKKKVIKWLTIGLGCILMLIVVANIDSSIANHNQMEYMTHGGIAADRNSMDLISSPSWIPILMILSALGAALSGVMFITSIISYWVNSTPTVVQQITETSSDTLIQLGKLYKEGLLTKQEFEIKKKQLLGEKENGNN